MQPNYTATIWGALFLSFMLASASTSKGEGKSGSSVTKLTPEQISKMQYPRLLSSDLAKLSGYGAPWIVVLLISADAEGKIVACTVKESNAPENVQNYVTSLVKKHWELKPKIVNDQRQAANYEERFFFTVKK